MALIIFSVLSLVLALSGNLLINYKKKIGFYIWIASDVTWIIVNFLGKPNYPQILMYVVYIAINIDGIIRWTKMSKEKSYEKSEPKRVGENESDILVS